MKKICMMAAILGITASAYTACPGSNYTAGQYNQGANTQQYNSQGQMPRSAMQNPSAMQRDYAQNPSAQPYGQGTYSTSRYQYNTQGQPASGMMMDDSAMMNTIQNSINNPNVTTSVSNGVVTLRGNVSSDQEKRDIENRVTNMNGVKKVDNQLKVTSSDTMTRSYNY